MPPRKFSPLFRFTADTEKLGTFVQRRWRDFETWFNANAVTKDADGNLDFQNTMLPINLGNIFTQYTDVDTLDWQPSTAAAYEDTNASVTVTDPGMPIVVLAWAKADIRNDTDTVNILSRLRIDVDGVQGTASASHCGLSTNFRFHIGAVAVRAFDPSTDFTVKVQGRQDTAGTVKVQFDQVELVVLVIPQ